MISWSDTYKYIIYTDESCFSDKKFYSILQYIFPGNHVLKHINCIIIVFVVVIIVISTMW